MGNTKDTAQFTRRHLPKIGLCMASSAAVILMVSPFSRAEPPKPEKVPQIVQFVNSQQGKQPWILRAEALEIRPMAAPLDPRAERIFNNLVAHVYGSTPVIKLLSCYQGPFCPDFTTHVNQPIVIFLPEARVSEILDSGKYANPEALMQFILAHEIGHVLYDTFAETHGYSPNGNPILYRDTYEGYYPFGHFVKKNNATAHIEVDVFGLALMHETGLTPPSLADISAFFETCGMAPAVHALRLATYSSTVQTLWP